ncbi:MULTISPECIES: hypothetical protein [unclassified Streptomyces]|uniref:hypothetical protein n=1 Tax=unclassified Streptomyces TaxID=2593676 RepID=UPI000B14A23C|nr:MULTISPECIES: hypothetical protein [unclassified Streptomyces]MCP3765756.1 hypothetical protein [Streptomyces sp. MAR25Y5]
MKTATRVGVMAVALLGLIATVPTASAAERPAPKANKPMETVDIKGVEVDNEASAETRRIIESDASAAVAASNVCGSGYTISTGAWRYDTYGTTYTWTNGTSGSGYYDKPICAVFFNDSGYTRYMGVRLKSNYTSDAPAEDFGAFGSYAGPVYQKRGYCGTVYSYMQDSNAKVLVDRVQTVGSCN